MSSITSKDPFASSLSSLWLLLASIRLLLINGPKALDDCLSLLNIVVIRKLQSIGVHHVLHARVSTLLEDLIVGFVLRLRVGLGILIG